MNRNIKLVVPIIGVLTFSHAYAQSSVTLYGLLDNSLQYTHNTGGQHSSLVLQSGQMQGSRWGLKGKEDLGSGNSAVFDIESGFNINNGKGNSGLEFSRQAYVGLANKSYGTVTLGRQTDTLLDLVLPVQGNWDLEYFTAPGDVDDGDGTVRLNNAVKWTSPVVSGFQGAAMYAFGNTAGTMGSGQAYNAAINYTHGPFVAALGYYHIDNGHGAGTTRGSLTADGNIYSPVNVAYLTASAVNIVRTGATYTIGKVTVGGYYSYSEYLADGQSSFKSAERYNNGSVFALWQFRPDTSFEFGYDYLKSHGDSSATYHQVTAAADYALSKRTDVYASVGYGHASGRNGNGAAQAVIADTYPDAGNSSQEIAMVGVRHKF